MRILLIIILSIILLPAAFATGQEGERIIVKGDTLELLSEPLYPYLLQHKELYKKIPLLEHGCSTGLWRGYVGLWQIQNDSLFLIDVYLCGRKDKSIKDLIFTDKNSKIFADWCSGDLNVSIGKPVMYFHSGYDRIREKTVEIAEKGGVIINTIEHINGFRPDDKGLSRNPDDIIEQIYNSIDWNNLDKFSKKAKVYATFNINEEGYIEDVKVQPSPHGEQYSEELKRALNSIGRFKILYWNGEKKKSSFGINIIFSKKNKRIYSRQQ